MPRSVELILINSGVLIWARESLGLSLVQAAAKLKVPPETLSAWEEGKAELGVTKLRQIAKAYRRPVSALLQASVPPPPELPKDFRTVASSSPAFSPETLVAIRDAQRIQEIATDLVERDSSLLPRAAIPQADYLPDSAQEVGLIERAHSEIPTSDQLRWGSANEAFNTWRAKLQSMGIVTLAKAMPRADCRGFSLPGAVPLIVVNSLEADQAKIFSLFHEYAHLTINESGVCLESNQVDVERWCNRFSSSFLIDAQQLRRMITGTVTSPTQVESLARRLKVSRHVIAIRLEEIRAASDNLYDLVLGEDRQRLDWEKPSLVRDDEEFRGLPQDLIRLSEVGTAFASMVLTAVDKQIISPTDALDFLDLRASKLGPFEDRVQKSINKYGS